MKSQLLVLFAVLCLAACDLQRSTPDQALGSLGYLIVSNQTHRFSEVATPKMLNRLSNPGYLARLKPLHRGHELIFDDLSTLDFDTEGYATFEVWLRPRGYLFGEYHAATVRVLCINFGNITLQKFERICKIDDIEPDSSIL